MPSLKDLKFKRVEFPERALPQAHFQEFQWIHPKLGWSEAARLLQQVFPKEARVERPADWYRRLMGTHAPETLPPGNGPFYVPEWTFEGMPDAEQKRYTEALKGAGFRRVVAHVCYVPETSEYLASAMRAAEGKHPWTVNPITYRAYLYPSLSGMAKAPLRPYNIARWRP